MEFTSFHKDKLHVVTMISNSAMFHSRYALYRDFAKRMQEAGVILWTVELQLKHRPFEVTSPLNPHHIQLRGDDELWHKENCLQIAMSRLPYDCKYVAWIDADIKFDNVNWVQDTINALQRYKVVQMWENAVDKDENGSALDNHVHTSFMSQYVKGGYHYPHKTTYSYWHPGYAWAARKHAIDEMGGLLTRGILGAGDHHMALAFIGQAKHSFHSDAHQVYKEYILDFQDICEKALRRSVGYVKGLIIHEFHGAKVNRKYWSRWQILIKNNFRPYHDIKPNMYGVFQWHDDHTDRFMRLRDDVYTYIDGRNEDLGFSCESRKYQD